MTAIQKAWFMIESALLLLTIAEYALGFIEAIIFADEKWDNHSKHFIIGAVLTAIDLIVGVLYEMVY